MQQLQSAIWFISGVFIGACNDVWVRLVKEIPVTEISSFRFFFSLITLIPFVIKNPSLLKSEHKSIHFVRGILFFSAITLWELGVKDTELSIATLISFSGPFFLLILSMIFLKEKSNICRISATTISFLMVLGIIDFKTFSVDSSFIILLISSLFFSITDLLNKKYSNTDNHLTAIIYYNIFAFIISLLLSTNNFIIPTKIELFYMFCLGLEANIYSYTFLKAFSLSDATFLSPFKYFEFIFSTVLGYVFFNEIPSIYSFVVIITIIISNTVLLLYEKKHNTNH